MIKKEKPEKVFLSELIKKEKRKLEEMVERVQERANKLNRRSR